MKIDIGTRIINNAAESRMRLAKARQAMLELREHERETLLAEILELEELEVMRAEQTAHIKPPGFSHVGPSISKIPDGPRMRHAVGGVTSFGVPVDKKCACGHTAYEHDGSGLVCGYCTCPMFTFDVLDHETRNPEAAKVKSVSTVNRVTSKKSKHTKKKRR
jgi:hypothetical protein